MTSDEVRCLLISDFTIDGLGALLTAEGGAPSVRSVVAPFDQVTQVLLDGTLECWRSRPDVAVAWTRPQSAVKSFGRLAGREQVPSEEILIEVDRFADRLRTAARRVSALLVPTWTWPSYDRGLGVLNMDTRVGPAYCMMRMNARLAEDVADDSNIHLLDAARWNALVGEHANSPKLWHLAKIAFAPEVFKHAAADIKAAVRAIKGLSRKLLILDLDDTLWGGIIGDAGWENLNLGGHNPVGEAFCTFQRSLKALSRRGVALGIVSKNTEALAVEAIDKHPEMVLRRADFAGWRINWDDKVQNIIDLADEINVGLDAVVFVDDNPAERARVREALPQVLVPEWPKDKLLYDKALAELSCFDSVAISEEDLARTRMYVSERKRTELRASAPSVEAYLASLKLNVTVEPLSTTNLVRATQLLNKTNQMNLTTRRMTETEFLAAAESRGSYVYVFRVSDRFDEYGLTGIASMTTDGVNAHVVDFVLSCRVIGRGVEQAMLHALVGRARLLGLQQLVVTYAPTSRNAPCKSFFHERSAFASSGHGRYVWDLKDPYPAPDHVTIHSSPLEH